MFRARFFESNFALQSLFFLLQSSFLMSSSPSLPLIVTAKRFVAIQAIFPIEISHVGKKNLKKIIKMQVSIRVWRATNVVHLTSWVFFALTNSIHDTFHGSQHAKCYCFYSILLLSFLVVFFLPFSFVATVCGLLYCCIVVVVAGFSADDDDDRNRSCRLWYIWFAIYIYEMRLQTESW